MRDSWHSHPGGALAYSAEFFQACLEYPSVLPVIAPAYYDGEELAAMVFGLPRRVLLDGKEQNLLLMTFFTVAEPQKGRGLGRSIWSECLQQAREAGYDAAVHYCAEGNISNHVTVSAAESCGLFPHRLVDVTFLMRAVQPSMASGTQHESSRAEFAAAANDMRPEVTLARRWTTAEAHWQCSRPGAVVATSSSGVVAGYGAPVLHESPMQCVTIDDVLWQDAPEDERARLASEFVAAAAGAGANIITLPLPGYVDPSPFRAVGFRKSRRLVHTYLTRWTNEPVVPVSAMYLDVI
jgi:GNAT superfamily N-acetyltransferase